jgi:hypothetical protein
MKDSAPGTEANLRQVERDLRRYAQNPTTPKRFRRAATDYGADLNPVGTLSALRNSRLGCVRESDTQAQSRKENL